LSDYLVKLVIPASRAILKPAVIYRFVSLVSWQTTPFMCQLPTARSWSNFQLPITWAHYWFGAGVLILYWFGALRNNKVALDWRVQIESASHPFVCVHFSSWCERCLLITKSPDAPTAWHWQWQKRHVSRRANRRSKRVQMMQVHMAAWDSHAHHGQCHLQHDFK